MRKKILFAALLPLVSCYQDLSKLKEGSSPGSAGNANGASSGSVIILDRSTLTLSFGKTEQIYATVLPANLTVNWMSLNTNVTTVSSTGLVTATGSGQTQIIASLSGGTIYAGCTVTVAAGFTANPADGSTIETLSNLVVTFSETMNTAALAPANYTVSGTGKGTLSTNPVAVTRSGNAYTLLFNGAAGNGDVLLTINSSNIKTQGGVSLAANTANYLAYGWYAFLNGDTANSIQQTADGGYIMAGSANANVATLGGQAPINAYAGGSDIYIVKVAATGAVSWYTFIGSGTNDYANSIQQTSDGGYIVTGGSTSNIASLNGQGPLNAFAANEEAIVVKLTAGGSVSWYTFLGGSGNDGANSLHQTNDGGYIVAGRVGANIPSLGGQTPLNSYSAGDDIFLVKLAASGSVSWYTFLGGTGNDQANSVQQTNDGGYVVAGQAFANIANLGGQIPLNAFVSGGDGMIVRLTAAGSVSWYTFLGGSGLDRMTSVRQASDGGYISAGIAGANIANLGGQTPLNAYAASDDMFIAKLTATGTVSWYTFLGGTGSDFATSIQQTIDGGYITTGGAAANIANLGGQTPLNSFVGAEDCFLVKLTSAGAVSWYTFLGGAGTERGFSVQQTSGGAYVIAGYSNSNIAGMGSQTPLNAYVTGNDLLVINLKSNGKF